MGVPLCCESSKDPTNMQSLPFFILLQLFHISPTFSKLACQTPVICDPSLESDIFLGASHFADETQCETSCTIGHPSNPCKFFTFVPNTAAQVPNCYKMTACKEMANPFQGAKSGAWSCDDEEIFCPAIGEVPSANSRQATWTCDRGVHPYGDDQTKIFQDTTCRTQCPSFETSTQGRLERADLIITSTCEAFEGNPASWSAAVPDNVEDSEGNAITSAKDNPTPACGCLPLILNGTVEEENGKVFQCSSEPELNADGNTVITDDMECFLECDGYPVWDLFCSMGSWSVPGLVSASEIYCHEAPTTGGPIDGGVTLSTYWPPGQ